MKYPIAIEPGDAGHAYGVVVPDLPGCFSAGDTLDEAIDNAKEAIQLWLEGDIPEHRTITAHQANPDFAGWAWAIVSIDLAANDFGTSSRKRWSGACSSHGVILRHDLMDLHARLLSSKSAQTWALILLAFCDRA